MKKSRFIALLLALAMMFSLCAAAAPEAEKDGQANSVKAAAQEVLSASAMNMWMYEDNDVTKGTIQELAATPAALSAPLKKLGLSTDEISAFTEDISFLREKTEYFKTMREEQDIRRNDFQLHYFFDEPEINGDRASLYVVESISFHYPELPDKLSEAVNYYDVELVRVNGQWLVAGIAAEGDDFDEAYKGTGFTAANAEEFFAAAAEQAAENEMDVNELAEEYGFTVEDEAEAQAANDFVYYDYDPDNATAYAYTYVSQMFGKDDITDSSKGKPFYNKNFLAHSSDCQNFASQCVWAGFNGSNSKNQIYDPTTGSYSPIMDCGGSYKWRGTIPGYSIYSPAWTVTNGSSGFAQYVENEMASSSPDIIALTGTIAENGNFASVYAQLKGAVLHVEGRDKDGNPVPFGHAIVVTDVLGPERSQIYYCAHTSDRKNLALTDRGYKTCAIKYIIPQQVKVRSAPEVKITADLVRPIPVGTQLMVGGTTDVNCYNIVLNIQTPSGSNSTFSAQNTNSISQAYTFNQVDSIMNEVYTITIKAYRTSTSTPVVYVYTIRAY